MLKTFNMFAAYNRWANNHVYEEAAKLGEEEFEKDTGAFFGSLKGTLNHVLVADRIWLNRFTGEGSAPDRLNAILFDDFESLHAARQAEDQRIVDWVGGLSEVEVSDTFTYRPISMPGHVITQKLGPTLSHFFNHQTHHRGQAHMMLTLFGRPSLALDLIYFLRTDEGNQWT